MSLVKIWVHAVWATKRREKLLTKEIRPLVFQHIHENALSKNIYMDCVGGHIDHVHCLFRIKNDQMVHDVLRLLKGESSHWVNSAGLARGKFGWQKEYLIVSVSESQVDRVRAYIKSQESHHKFRSFRDEYAAFARKYGFPVKG